MVAGEAMAYPSNTTYYLHMSPVLYNTSHSEVALAYNLTVRVMIAMVDHHVLGHCPQK